jgi:hypothetical protein
VVMVAACRPSTRGHPVYDTSSGLPPPDQVATLHGQIIAIDGNPVPPQAEQYEVLPRCYLLRMTGQVRTASATQSTYSTVYMGEQEFALRTEAGRRYYIELWSGERTGGAVMGPVEARWTATQFDLAGQEGPPVTLYAACP